MFCSISNSSWLLGDLENCSDSLEGIVEDSGAGSHMFMLRIIILQVTSVLHGRQPEVLKKYTTPEFCHEDGLTFLNNSCM